MHRGEDPPPDTKTKAMKTRRKSFSDDLKATTINSSSHSPLRRLSVSQNKTQSGTEALNHGLAHPGQNYASNQNISQESRNSHHTAEIKTLQKTSSLYGGGFEAIINKVSDTYKIEDILPKTLSTQYMVNQEVSSVVAAELSHRDPLSRQGTENFDSRKSTFNHKKKSSVDVDSFTNSMNSDIVRRKSALRKSNWIDADQGIFGAILVDDQDGVDLAPQKLDIAPVKDNEGSRFLQKLIHFDNRSAFVNSILKSDHESICSSQSDHSDDDKEYLDDQTKENFTGKLLSNHSLFVLPEINVDKSTPDIIIPAISASQSLAPQSDLGFKRRASFAVTLLNTMPSQADDDIATSTLKPRTKLTTTGDKAIEKSGEKLTISGKLGNNNLLPKLGASHAPPLPKIKDTPSTLTNDSTTNTIRSWKKLREDSRAVQREPTESQKFVGIEEVVNVVQDLKSLGMDPNIINEIDKTTLKSVIGVKKWVESTKQKKMAQNSALRKLIKNIDHRLVSEVPKSLNSDIVISVIPILINLKKEYRSQLGSDHEYIGRLDSFIESLSIQSDYRKRKSISKANDNFWTNIIKAFKFHKRVSPMTMNQRNEIGNSEDYLIPISLQEDD